MTDLERPDLAELDWSAQQRRASLSAVYDHAVGLTNSAEGWYARKRPSKKRWGRALRVCALLLGAAAVVLPILAEMSTTDGKPSIAPGWSAVALAAAATLVTLDHYFGFSSAWMRFMAAELRLTHLRHDFQYAWNAQRAAMADPPADGDVATLLALAKSLAIGVNDIVAQETDHWVMDFRGSLERTEQALGASINR